MNFQDIISKNNKQLELLGNLQPFIQQVKSAKADAEKICNWLFEEGFKNNLGSYSSTILDRYTSFREKLISIDAYYLGIAISELKHIYENEIIKTLLDEIEEHYKEVYRIKNITASVNMVHEFKNCNRSLDLIISNYNILLKLIGYVNSINIDLSQGIVDVPFKIRFYSENNSISSLIENARLINNIYNEVNNLIGDGEELKYCRVESGTLEFILLGCGTALLSMKPLLELGYKVYSEQFSRKARLEIQEKEIKVRGDYLKLLKEANESKSLSDFNVKNEKDLLEAIANIDSDIKLLFSKNPFIKINDQNLGSEHLKDTSIPLNLLESSDLKIDDLKELEIEEIKV